MSEEPRYMATINGANVGMYSSIAEADTAAMQAASRGVGGLHQMNVPRLIEVRDTKNGYLIVGSRQV